MRPRGVLLAGLATFAFGLALWGLPHLLSGSRLSSWADASDIAGGALAVIGLLTTLVPRREEAGHRGLLGGAALPRRQERQPSSLAVPQRSGPVVGQGRLVAELVAIGSRRRRGPQPRVHVIAGLGGIGKTAVAAEVAHRLSRVRGLRVWWVPAADEASVRLGMLDLAGRLGATSEELLRARLGEANAPDLVWRCLDRQRAPWLLVFDNADAPGDLDPDGEPATGRGWLRPPGRHGMVLVTSRQASATVWGPFSSVRTPAELTPDDGARILCALAPGAGTAAEAMSLSERLGDLPLALHLAGGYLARPLGGIRTFAGYRAALDERFAETVRRAEPAQRQRALLTTWEISLDGLAAAGVPAARHLLRLLSCFAEATPIPLRLLDETVLGLGGQRDAALNALLHTGLIKAGSVSPAPDLPAEETVVVHSLVAEISRAHLDREPDGRHRLALAGALMARAVTALDPESPGSWPLWRLLTPHAHALLSREMDAEAADRIAAAVPRIVWALTESGDHADAEELDRFALDRLEPRLGDHAVHHIRSNLGVLLQLRGRFEQAEEELRTVVLLRSEHLGEDDPLTLKARFRYAQILQELERWDEAEREFRVVLELEQQVFGEGHHATLGTRYSLARLLRDQGRPAEAERELSEVPEAAEASGAVEDDVEEGFQARLIRARVLREQHRFAEAEAEIREVLARQGDRLGPEHPETLNTRHTLAGLLWQAERRPEAERELRETLAGRTRVLGEHHLETLNTWHHLALLLWECQRLEEAEREYRAVLAHRREKLGDDHPGTLSTWQGLAGVLFDLRCLDEAADAYRRVLELRTRRSGGVDPRTVDALTGLARVFRGQGELSEAETVLRTALASFGERLGPDHPKTLMMRQTLAGVWLEQGDREAAEREYSEVLRLRRARLGDGHPETSATRRALEGLARE